MSLRPKISVVIPTLNEEKDLPETLASIKGFADEIIIVDSGSTDKTVEISKKAGAKVFFHKFISYSETRNFGDEKATGEWILSIEADVTVSKDLAKEIKNSINLPNYSAYSIGRENIIWGKIIRHTDWAPEDDRHIWLYKKDSGKWISDVHEEFITKHKIGKLQHYLLHKNYETVSEYINKINSYSDLAIKQKSNFPNWWCLRDFFKRYICKLGFLDGYRGLFLSYLQSIYYITITVKRNTKNT